MEGSLCMERLRGGLAAVGCRTPWQQSTLGTYGRKEMFQVVGQGGVSCRGSRGTFYRPAG
jgi:hypothetical protein